MKLSGMVTQHNEDKMDRVVNNAVVSSLCVIVVFLFFVFV